MSKIQMKIKEEGTSLIYLQKLQGKLTLSIHARYFYALQIDIMLRVELKVEAQQIQSTVEMNLFYCFFFFSSEEANDCIFLSLITLEDQPKKERMYLDI